MVADIIKSKLKSLQAVFDDLSNEFGELSTEEIDDNVEKLMSVIYKFEENLDDIILEIKGEEDTDEDDLSDDEESDDSDESEDIADAEEVDEADISESDSDTKKVITININL